MTPLETMAASAFAINATITFVAFVAIGSGLMFGCALSFLAAALWWCIVPPVGGE